jgi:hypothetical protein
MRSRIDKLLETLLIGLTGKTLDRQKELIRHSAIHFSGTISNQVIILVKD